MSEYQSIQKSEGYRINELVQSLLVIKDSIDGIVQGKLHQFIPLCGQLRSLLTERSRRNKPLLIDLADMLGQDLRVYHMPGLDHAGSLQEAVRDALFVMLGFPITLHQELPNQIQSTLVDLLDLKAFSYAQKHYTVRQIIQYFANKAGGSHYSPDMPKDFAEMMTTQLSGQSVFQNALVQALVQIGAIVLELGKALIRKVVEFDIHLLICLSEQNITEPGFVIDYKYPRSSIRIFCYFESRYRIRFGVTGISGLTEIASSERTIDHTTQHHIMLSLTFEDDLSTKLAVNVNGEPFAERIVHQPLVVTNEFLWYDIYTNRAFDNDSLGMSFGLALMGIYDGREGIAKRCSLITTILAHAKNNTGRCAYYTRGSYGHVPSGENAMKMTGHVSSWTIEQLIRGEIPDPSGA